jgi:hypothetical protein
MIVALWAVAGVLVVANAMLTGTVLNLTRMVGELNGGLSALASITKAVDIKVHALADEIGTDVGHLERRVGDLEARP